MDLNESQMLDLLRVAREARESAYAPFSEFKVGAAVLVESGDVYTGCNVENASYGLTVCAERVAVFNAVSSGERKIAAVAIVAGEENPARPCGACLQVMAEFAPDNGALPIITANTSLNYEVHSLDDYLPMRFTLD